MDKGKFKLKTKGKSNTYCCVPQCDSKASKNPELSFHRFPNRITSSNRFQKWRFHLRIGNAISSRTVVCSRHFERSDFLFPDKKNMKVRSLKRTAIPTLCLPVAPYDREKNVAQVQQKVFPTALLQAASHDEEENMEQSVACLPIAPKDKFKNAAEMVVHVLSSLSVCSECGMKFTMQKNLHAHMRAFHAIDPPVTGSMICPADCCTETFHHLFALRQHLQQVHDIQIESETLEFPTLDDFQAWRVRFQSLTGSFFRQRCKEGVVKTQNIRRTIYLCHRTNYFKSNSMGLRNHGWKSGTTCPATIRVDRPLETEGPVTINVWKTHLGHDLEPVLSEEDLGGVCVVLPAAGKGERMQADQQKQFIPLRGKPVVLHTVEAFLKMSIVDRVVVVSNPDTILQMVKILAPAANAQRLLVAKGGDTRHASIRAGVNALKSYGSVPRIVVVHDAVRPFVTEELVSRVVAEASCTGAAGLVCPLVSTVVKPDPNQTLAESLDRSQYLASEMPQAFRLTTLCQAYEECDDTDMNTGTECLQLVLKYCGIQAKLLPAPRHLWKITHSEDIFAAEGVLKANESVAIVSVGRFPDLEQPLRNELSSTFREVRLEDSLTESSIHLSTNWIVLGSFSLGDIKRPLRNPTYLVWVCGSEFKPTFDARVLKKMNLFVYYAVRPDISQLSKMEEWSKMVTSILKDNNPYICGIIFPPP